MACELAGALLGDGVIGTRNCPERPDRPRGVRLLSSILLVLATAVAAWAAPAPRRATSLVVVSMDTLRPDHLASYGYARRTSPYLDSFARTSTRFARAYSTSAWTLPAHYSIFTGRFPATPELFRYERKAPLHENETMLAERLRDAGHDTAAFVGGGLMAAHWGFAQGFDVHRSAGATLSRNRAAVEGWARAHDPARPFFLFLHGYDVHEPHAPPASLRERFLAGPVPEACRGVVPRGDGSDAACRAAPGAAAYVAAQYDAQILAADRALADLLKILKRRRLLDRALVVILSDHGEELLERGRVGHAHTLHEEVLRAVLLIRRPGARGRTVEAPVSLLDVGPTVLELLGLPVPPDVHGTSLAPLLHGDAAGSPVFAVTGVTRDAWTYASVEGRYKLVSERDGRRRLFDLAEDPAERRDLAGDPVATTRLSGMIERQAAWARRVGLRLDDDPTAAPPPVPADVREQLRALGYAE